MTKSIVIDSMRAEVVDNVENLSMLQVRGFFQSFYDDFIDYMSVLRVALVLVEYSEVSGGIKMHGETSRTI